MRVLLAIGLVVLGLGCRNLDSRAEAGVRPPGPLVVVGGGGTPDEVLRLALQLAGGAQAHVVVLPQASEREDRGQESAQMFRDVGAASATNLADSTSTSACALIAEADLIWFPGGDQARLMEDLSANGLLEAVRERHRAGAVVGGTSAGAAVMSARMLAGPPRREGLRALTADVRTGLGLWPGVVVDQHFVERERFGRLIACVLDEPSLVGIGIAERTAAIVRFERRAGLAQPIPVLTAAGEGSIVVVDARGAQVASVSDAEGLHSARGMALAVLRAGDSWSP